MAEVTIEAPWSGLQGERAGVHFTDGKATADLEKDAGAIQYFANAGYTVNGDSSDDVSVRPIGDLTVKELGVLAQQKGVAVPSSTKKEDIVKLLEGKDAADANEPESQLNPDAQPANVTTEASNPPAGTAYGTNPAPADKVTKQDVQGVEH